jgi:hypothetical protein
LARKEKVVSMKKKHEDAMEATMQLQQKVLALTDSQDADAAAMDIDKTSI